MQSYGVEEEDETILHHLCICQELGRRRMRNLSAYYMQDLDGY